MKSGISKISYDTLHINLYLTYGCPFKCDHCMMNSSPAAARFGWMEPSFIQLVLEPRIREFQEAGEELDWEADPFNRSVNINLVGGEPTWDLDKFERLFTFVDTMDVNFSLEMTTNGWWLENLETCNRFLGIVGPRHASMGIQVRISNSGYHLPFRNKEWAYRFAKNGRMDKAFDMDAFFQHPEEFYETEDRCPYCEEGELEFIYAEDEEDPRLQGQSEGYWCARCEELVSEYDRYRYRDQKFHQFHWFFEQDADSGIYVDNQGLDLEKISATGRGKALGGWQDSTCYPHAPILSIGPKGELRDLCCSGGCQRPGQFDDRSIEEWIRYRRGFIEHLHDAVPKRWARCGDCRKHHQTYQRQWTKQHGLLQPSGA